MSRGEGVKGRGGEKAEDEEEGEGEGTTLALSRTLHNSVDPKVLMMMLCFVFGLVSPEFKAQSGVEVPSNCSCVQLDA